MNMITPPATGYRPPCLSSQTAALARCLSRHRGMRNLGGFDVQVTEAPKTMTDPLAFDLLPHDAQTPPPSQTSGQQQHARLTMPRAMLHRLLATLDPAAPGAPPAMIALLLELRLENLLDRLEAAFPSLPLRLRPASAAPAPAAFAIGLAIHDGTSAATLRLDMDAAAAGAFASALALLPDWPQPLPSLPVPLHLRMLVADVMLSELDAAAAGDVILPDALPAGELLAVAGERFAWRARRDGARVQLLSPRLRPPVIGLERWVMSQEIAADDAAGLDELPVRLAFELGRLELPLAELAVLGPGHVFELARDEAQPVDILANGRRIGQGRIVNVAGSIGVQIVRIGRA